LGRQGGLSPGEQNICRKPEPLVWSQGQFKVSVDRPCSGAAAGSPLRAARPTLPCAHPRSPDPDPKMSTPLKLDDLDLAIWFIVTDHLAAFRGASAFGAKTAAKLVSGFLKRGSSERLRKIGISRDWGNFDRLKWYI